MDTATVGGGKQHVQGEHATTRTCEYCRRCRNVPSEAELESEQPREIETATAGGGTQHVEGEHAITRTCDYYRPHRKVPSEAELTSEQPREIDSAPVGIGEQHADWDERCSWRTVMIELSQVRAHEYSYSRLLVMKGTVDTHSNGIMCTVCCTSWCVPGSWREYGALYIEYFEVGADCGLCTCTCPICTLTLA